MTSNTEQARIIIERLQSLEVWEIMKAAPESREAILETIRQLCQVFCSASPIERVEIISHVRAEFSFVFFWFARMMSEKAVRESAPQAIWDGLIAIVLENFTRDFRDSLVDVMLLYHSATKLGLDVEGLFSKAASLAVNPNVALPFVGFHRENRGTAASPHFSLRNLVREIRSPTGKSKLLAKSDAA
jgi:hypothetical protein